MLFYSFEFLFVFLPVVLILYFLIYSKLGPGATIIFLVCSSFVFYGTWNPSYIPLLAFSIIANYLLGERIQLTRDKRLLLFGIFLNLLFLGYFKYTNFFLGNVDAMLGTGFQVEKIILPLAISFYTFQQIAWLADSYSKADTIQSGGFWRYALFVSFFPQLIAGPIVHHSEMMPQFARSETFKVNWVSFSVGATIFIIGLFKKVVIADSMGAVATPVFDASLNGPVDPTLAWVAAASYMLQVYFDFSGYSDMAIGLGRMFNIRLPVNFASPLKATSISELWRRWHITMTRFFMSYVYNPLSLIFLRRQVTLKIRGHWAIYLTTLFTFLVIGLWHGANWTFILFGAMHGVLVISHHVWRTVVVRRGLPDIPRFPAIFLTIFVFGLTCVMYRAENVNSAINIYESMLLLTGVAFSIIDVSDLAWIVFACFVALFLPNTQELMRKYRPGVNLDANWSRKITGRLNSALVWRPGVAWGIAIATLFICSFYYLLDADRVQEFIYFQF